jgi:hypothetical protein
MPNSSRACAPIASRHELVRDLFRELGIQAATNVDLGQFFMLTLVVGPEFGDLALDVGLFGVGPGVH